jgi:hypothetical protein
MKKGLIIPLILLIAAIAFAGGFQLSVESGQSRNEVLIVKTFGCHVPSDAKLSGTAEGIVNGERKTINLQFKHDKKGVFTIAKQWIDEGVWVITIKGKYNGMNSNAIVEIDPKSNLKLAKGEIVYDLKVKIVNRDVKSEEITKLLNNLNKNYAGV